MDAFGIFNAVRGAAAVLLQTMRRTGRTTALLESLKDGDRVVFLDSHEAKRVANLVRELGVKIDTLVIPPDQLHWLFDHPTSKGRTVFDHSWVEQHLLHVLDRASLNLGKAQREASGPGMAHVETRLKAREISRWGGVR